MKTFEQIPSPPNKELLEWVEPLVRQLDVRETALNQFTGGDGEVQFPDCTRS